jgi:ferredoxin-NADP reductase
VNPLWTRRTPRARVDEIRDETRDARTLVLRPGRGWRRHRAGQHVRLGVWIDGRQRTRTYSISSSPEREDGRITLTVKAVEGGLVSSHLARVLRPGAIVSLGLPEGAFVLPEVSDATDAHASPLRPLFVTAGSGITPVMSMLRSLAARDAMPDVVHLHYAPRAEDVIFADELAALAEGHASYRLVLVTTREPDAAGALPKRFDAASLAAACPDWADRDAWVCGPEPLLAAAEAHWQRHRLASRLHLESFGARLAPVSRDVAGGRVRFARSGRDALADGATCLLRVAEDAGLAPRHGCRRGICHTCVTTLRAGCVRDLRTGAVIDEPGAAVQICVCAAAGPVELEL